MEEKTTAVAATGQQTVEIGVGTLQYITSSSIYLMGFSFIIGSGFTILMLMLLDYMRMRREAKNAK